MDTIDRVPARRAFFCQPYPFLVKVHFLYNASRKKERIVILVSAGRYAYNKERQKRLLSLPVKFIKWDGLNTYSDASVLSDA